MCVCVLQRIHAEILTENVFEWSDTWEAREKKIKYVLKALKMYNLIAKAENNYSG